MTETILKYLEQLYTDDVQPTYDAIIDRIGAQAPKPRGKLFDARQITLITYGDTLQRNGEAPLFTLHQFANEYLTESFSHIHILPFFPWSSDDGFAVMDFYAVDPTLGTWDDIDALQLSFRLMFDAVFNHMSSQSEWFRNFLGDEQKFENMFVTESPATDLSSVTRPRTTPLLTPFEKTSGETVHVWTTFSADQVDLNFGNPQTLLRMLDVLLFYVESGAHIIRLDAIAYLWKIAGTSSIHLEQTHTVIKLMRAVLDVVAPDTLIVTETNVPHAENVSYFGDGYDEAQMVYNFTLPPLLFHTMLSGNTVKLRDWINSLDTPSDQTTFFNFTASHDGIGVRPVEGILAADELKAMIEHVESTGGRVSYKTNPDGSQSPYELNVSYVDAITDFDESLQMQVKRFLVSQAIAMSLAGMPAIYIHSLLGSHNDVVGMEKTGMNRTINRAKLDLDEILFELEDDASFRKMVFETYLYLIQVRANQPEFHPNAQQEAVDMGDEAVLGLLRTSTSGKILALFNVTNQPKSVDLSLHLSTQASDCLRNIAVQPGELELSPYDIWWLRIAK